MITKANSIKTFSAVEIADLIQTSGKLPIPGTFAVARWSRPAKTLKGAPEIIKTVSALVRTGLTYSNQKAVSENRKNGFLPKDPQPLPWGKWAIYPYLIEHKGKHYLRLYPCFFETLENGEKVSRPKVKTNWFLDGKKVGKNEICHYLQASEKRESNPLCFTVTLDNVLRLGNLKLD